jgi:hypothetical protein
MGTTVGVPAVAVIQPPAWDGPAYAAEHAPLLTLSATD